VVLIATKPRSRKAKEQDPLLQRGFRKESRDVYIELLKTCHSQSASTSNAAADKA
jgi:hypothetical protein